jgi:hypothetical protein
VDDALVLLHGAEVPAVDLGNHHVEVAAAKERRSGHDVYVERGEQDRGELTDGVGGAPGDAVDAHSLTRAVLEVAAATDDGHFEVQVPGGALHLALEAGDGELAVEDFLANEIGVCTGAARAEGREEIDGFEEVTLALGVIADEQIQATTELNMGLCVVAVVLKAKFKQVHR